MIVADRKNDEKYISNMNKHQNIIGKILCLHKCRRLWGKGKELGVTRTHTRNLFTSPLHPAFYFVQIVPMLL